MDIAGTSARAGGKHARMHLTLGFVFTDTRKYFGQHVVEEIGRPLLLGDLRWRLDPSHFIHDPRTIHHLELRQCALDLLPVRRAQAVLLKSDPSRCETG